jgi:hypothetical protein
VILFGHCLFYHFLSAFAIASKFFCSILADNAATSGIADDIELSPHRDRFLLACIALESTAP